MLISRTYYAYNDVKRMMLILEQRKTKEVYRRLHCVSCLMLSELQQKVEIMEQESDEEYSLCDSFN